MQTKPQPDHQTQEMECLIYGRVQMVLFRDFARRNARSLGATGFIENRDDGSVRVVAQGNKQALTRFAELLKRGSLLARVERVDIRERPPSETFETFEIRY